MMNIIALITIFFILSVGNCNYVHLSRYHFGCSLDAGGIHNLASGYLLWSLMIIFLRLSYLTVLMKANEPETRVWDCVPFNFHRRFLPITIFKINVILFNAKENTNAAYLRKLQRSKLAAHH